VVFGSINSIQHATALKSGRDLNLTIGDDIFPSFTEPFSEESHFCESEKKRNFPKPHPSELLVIGGSLLYTVSFNRVLFS
jgi:hypothetical protein